MTFRFVHVLDCRKTVRIIGPVLRFVSLIALLLPIAVSASIIPQSGFSGRPGDGTCRDCHPATDFVAQDSSVIIGLPDILEPETTYSCTLVLRYKGMDEWTFEMCTVDSASNQAGYIARVDTVNTLIDTFVDALYFKNSLPGAYLGRKDSARWAFDYTSPPAGSGPVSYYWTAYVVNRKHSDKYHLFANKRTVPTDDGR